MTILRASNPTTRTRSDHCAPGVLTCPEGREARGRGSADTCTADLTACSPSVCRVPEILADVQVWVDLVGGYLCERCLPALGPLKGCQVGVYSNLTLQ